MLYHYDLGLVVLFESIEARVGSISYNPSKS